MGAAPCRHMGQSLLEEGQQHLSKTIISLGDYSRRWTDVNVTKPMIASVPDVLYTFLVTNITCLTSEQTAFTGWRDFQWPYQHVMTTPPPPAMQMDAHQRLQSRKMKGGKKQKLKAMKYDQSLLKKNPSCYLECTVLYKRYRSLALNIGLFKKNKKRKIKSWRKCPLEQTVYSQSSKFRFCNKKKRCCRGKELVYCLFFVKA